MAGEHDVADVALGMAHGVPAPGLSASTVLVDAPEPTPSPRPLGSSFVEVPEAADNSNILRSQPSVLKKPEGPISWVPLPYHPLIARPVAKALGEASMDSEVRIFYKAAFRGTMPFLRPDWKNSDA